MILGEDDLSSYTRQEGKMIEQREKGKTLCLPDWMIQRALALIQLMESTWEREIPMSVGV